MGFLIPRWGRTLMIRTASVICAAILVTLCFACVQPTSTVRQKAIPSICTSQGIVDGRTFVSTQKIQYLYGNPNPAAVGSSYSSPVGQTGQIGSPFDYYVILAFDNAPDFFKGDLCSLDRVFINLNTCSGSNCLDRAWGYRERPAQKAGGPYGRYIAISGGLWGGGSWTQTYHDFETAVLQRLLGWNAPWFDSAAPDDFATIVLAALAHEMGHVRWYDTLVPSPGGATNPTSFCSGNFFDSWQGGSGSIHAPPRWRNVLAPSQRQGVPDKHKNAPQTNDIDAAITAGQFNGTNGAGDLLHQLYTSQAPWASFFGSLAPDEDFIETYKLNVLTHVAATTPLTSLHLKIPTTPAYD